MLLALHPLLLEAAARTIVVGVLDGSARASIAGADAVWLDSPTAEQVASAVRDTRLPVGVTVDDVSALDGLLAAGATAVECGSPGIVEVARDRGLSLWCPATQADRAIAIGLPAERIVSELGSSGGATVVGTTVAGDGPGTWGAVVRAVHGGARVVRTTDVRSVRRVVTVMDRLAVARAATGQRVAP